MLLFREQKRSKNLNIITGFQIIDGVRHIFIVEGLRNEGIKEILKSLPLDQNNGRYTQGYRVTGNGLCSLNPI